MSYNLVQFHTAVQDGMKKLTSEERKRVEKVLSDGKLLKLLAYLPDILGLAGCEAHSE